MYSLIQNITAAPDTHSSGIGGFLIFIILLLILVAAITVLGALTGRKIRFIRHITPITYLLVLAAFISSRNILQTVSIFPLNPTLVLLLSAILMTASAVLSSFIPKGVCFILGYISSALIFVCYACGIISGFSAMLYVPVIASALALYASSASFVPAISVSETGSTDSHSAVSGSRSSMSHPAAPLPKTGLITFLNGTYAGQTLSLAAEEELYIGSNAAYCHIIIPDPRLAPCHLRICWQASKETYRITNDSAEYIFFQSTNPLVPGYALEVAPGTEMQLGNTGYTLRVG